MDETVTILCVDDETNVHRALQRVLVGSDNYRLFPAQSGEEALQILEKKPEIQVIIADYRLPGISGMEFLASSVKINPDTVRIILSDLADTNAMLEAIDTGHVFKFVPKPWDDDDLYATTTQAVEVAGLKHRNKYLQLQLQQRNKELNEINANLEKIVAQRTKSLELRSHVLQTSQDILEQLPLGVIGLDSDNYIVLINSFALDLLSSETPIILGDRADTHFNSDLLSFIQSVRLNGNAEEHFKIGSHLIHATGSYLNDTRERGVFITLNCIEKTGSSS
ncbi:MAG: response regulator [Thermodesulfobacteriota bacterium]